MRKYFLVVLVITCVTNLSFGFSQEIRDFDFYASTNLGVGYSYSFGEPNERNFHLLDFEYNKVTYGGLHGGGYSYGLGTDFILNPKERFTLGPKISGALYFGGFIIGSNLTYYTNFNQSTLRYVPFFGFGGEKGKLTISPNIILSNKEYNPIDRGLINISYNFTLKREKRKKKK